MTVTSETSALARRWPLWLMVISASLIVFFSMGTRNMFGLFLDPISDSMSWGREVFSMTLALQNIMWGVTQPFAGAIADRYGAGKVMALGGVLYAVGILAISFSGVPVAMHLAGGVLIGIAQGLASMNIGMAVVARRTPMHRRTLVMSVVTMGGSAGQMVLSPLAQTFIDGYGWITAMLIVSMMVLIIVPLTIPLAGRPQATVGSTQTFGAALREASRHRGYILLIAGFFVCGFHVTFIGNHLPSYIRDLGLDPGLGAVALMIIGMFNIFGTLLAGLLGDRYSKKYMLSFLYLARSAAILFLLYSPVSETTILIFSGMIGLLWLSTVPLTTGLVGQIFGAQYIGMLAGIVFFSHQVGAFLGVWLGGLLFDIYGSYDIVWWLSIALGVLAALVHFPIDERPLERKVAA